MSRESRLYTVTSTDPFKAIARTIGITERVVIAGVPRAGKTTLAGMIGGRQIIHTDSLINECDWSEASLRIARRLDYEGDYLVEGVTAVRAVRKWLAHNEESPKLPFDVMVYLSSAWPGVELSKGQVTLGKGCNTVWAEIREQVLAKCGTVIELGV